MQILLFLIFVASVIIIFKLNKIIKIKDVKHNNNIIHNEAIDKKISVSESILGIKYSNREEIYKKIESFKIDIEYLEDDLDFNAEYFDCGVICGEIAMFKDLEAGNLDTVIFSGHDLNNIEEALIRVFPHIKHNKRKIVVNNILKNKK